MGRNELHEPCTASDTEGPFTCVVSLKSAGQRLDHFLTEKLTACSRSALNRLISAQQVRVNGMCVKAGYRLRTQDVISLAIPEPPPQTLVPEQIEFDVLYEDAHLLAINKPPGLVVHPGGGHLSGTLVHGLLYHCTQLPGLDAQRPGIIHRLDKDTSGILLVAKTEQALQNLMADFKNRKVCKIYHALIMRWPGKTHGRIVQPIGRHPVNRKKMAIRPELGKYAATNWRIRERYSNGWCWAEINIETGRTHQIRVHMASVHAPVVGDVLYGGGVGQYTQYVPERQMLHASSIQFCHPSTGQVLCLTAPLFADMQTLLDALRINEQCGPMC
ncbi:MAG: RluA family pseudouridine synthase [Desulfobulbus oligotrophicus]|nr:RluA family pseudouridine synthase [Desulfobulbus oligotrophicus]